jgi:hypothetical protein
LQSYKDVRQQELFPDFFHFFQFLPIFTMTSRVRLHYFNNSTEAEFLASDRRTLHFEYNSQKTRVGDTMVGINIDKKCFVHIGVAGDVCRETLPTDPRVYTGNNEKYNKHKIALSASYVLTPVMQEHYTLDNIRHMCAIPEFCCRIRNNNNICMKAHLRNPTVPFIHNLGPALERDILHTFEHDVVRRLLTDLHAAAAAPPAVAVAEPAAVVVAEPDAVAVVAEPAAVVVAEPAAVVVAEPAAVVVAEPTFADFLADMRRLNETIARLTETVARIEARAVV